MADERPILGVTGRPVLHSLSPALFRELFAEAGLEAAYLRVAAAGAEEAVALARGAGLRGLNVTSPFKDGAAALADELSPDAERLGAANALLFRPDLSVLGANTDPEGVALSLRSRGVAIAGARCLVIGAGGAGRSAAWALLREGGSVTIANRSPAKARDLGAALSVAAGRSSGAIGAAALSELPALAASSDIIVSALSSSALSSAFPDPAAWLPRGRIVVDADYREGSLAAAASDLGCLVVTGLEWLLHQALPAYSFFLGAGRGAAPERLAAAAGRIGAALASASRPARKAGRAIALVGLPASGKTCVGRALAARSGGRPFADADAEIEAEAGMSVTAIFASEGEAGFRAREERAIARLIARGGGIVIATGGGAATRSATRELFRRDCLTVWLYASPERAYERSRRGARPLLSGGDPLGRMRELEAERRFDYASSSDLLVSAELFDPKSIAETIHDEISRSI